MEKSKGHYFYVLQCRDGSFYAGYTTHIKRRVEKHNSGKGAKYTNSRKPVTLIFYQEFSSKSEALKAEAQFKRLRRSQKEEFLKEEGVQYDVATKELQ
ncbi:GIY-YIG nuclease family protein [Bacillus songklensis]|uniref:GIY-YIG nuclease family protein n=1 Tax=Bacillus songklensis TaxID=1069116 RepID=A0ABV8AYM8_9BACI